MPGKETMTETIIAAVISAAASLLVSLVTSNAQQNKTRALLDYRLEQLEKKQDKYNSVIERTFRLEEHEAVMDEKIKVANHRIEDLERQL